MLLILRGILRILFMGEFSQKYTCTRPTPNFMRMRLFEYYIKERILPEVNPKDADGNVLYDLNQIVTPGMFKLEPGSTNADNIPSSITGDGTYVFVAPMDGDVLKQYLVIAKDGKVRVTTRVRISEAWTYWYPWSKEFPPCELSGEVEAAPGNAYFGFGPYVLNVPAANNFACGDKFTVIARAGEGQILGPDGELITAKPPESSDGIEVVGFEVLPPGLP